MYLQQYYYIRFQREVMICINSFFLYFCLFISYGDTREGPQSNFTNACCMLPPPTHFMCMRGRFSFHFPLYDTLYLVQTQKFLTL